MPLRLEGRGWGIYKFVIEVSRDVTTATHVSGNKYEGYEGRTCVRSYMYCFM